MIEEKWSGQQDLNLHQPIDGAQGDSDKQAPPLPDARPIAGCDSDKLDAA
jgi:hypothetical protein